MDNLFHNQSIIITLDADELLFNKIHQLAELGYSIVEINGIDQELLKRTISKFPSLQIGAGNVINTHQLEACYQSGAHFVTSPGFSPSMAQTANVYSIVYLPGVATISEAMQAIHFSCHHVRPFPATLSFCTLLNKYLPKLRLFPAEIECDEIDHFLSLPAVNAVSVINPEIKQLRALQASVFESID